MFAARFHNVDVFVLKVKDYDVCVSGKYMYISCIICLLWRQKQIT